MTRIHNLAQAGAAAVALAALVGAGTVDAVADPPADTYRNFAAVGSDTTQDVWNGLTNGTGPLPGVGSYNAFGSATIKTKAAGAVFNRPAGSSNGVRALSAVWDPSYPSHDFQGTALVKEEVDFARSSSGPTTGAGLTYLPFARDAVSVAIKPFESGTTASNLTTAQLTAIYGGRDDNPGGLGIGYDATTGKPTYQGRILSPALPQNGSGTRSFFLGSIGVTVDDLGSYVEPTPSTLPENDGTALTVQGALIPFSAAQWIAQRNGVTTNTTAGVNLLRLNAQAPTAGTAPNLAPGALFGTKNPAGNYNSVPTAGVGVFNRDTYNVIPTSFLSGTTKQQRLVTLLTSSTAGSLGSNAAKGIIRKYGFGTLAYLGDPSFYRDGAWLH